MGRSDSATWINPNLRPAQRASLNAHDGVGVELTSLRNEVGAGAGSSRNRAMEEVGEAGEGARSPAAKLATRCLRWTQSFLRIYPNAPVLERMNIHIDFLNRFNRPEMNLLYQAYCLSQYRPNVLRLTVVICVGVFAFFGYEGFKLVNDVAKGRMGPEQGLALILSGLTVGPMCTLILIIGVILWLDFTKPCWKLLSMLLLIIGFATAILFNTMGFWSEIRQKRQNVYDMFNAEEGGKVFSLALEFGEDHMCTGDAELWLEKTRPHRISPFKESNWEQAMNGVRPKCQENVLCTFFVLDLEYWIQKAMSFINRVYPLLAIILTSVVHLDFIHSISTGLFIFVWEIALDLAFTARSYDNYFDSTVPFENAAKDLVRKAAFTGALLFGCHMTDRFSRLNFLHYWETSVKNMQLKDEIRTLNMAGQRNEAWGAMLNTPMELVLRELRLLTRAKPQDVPVKHKRVLDDIVSILSSTISLDLPDIGGQLGVVDGSTDLIAKNLLYTLGGQVGKRSSAADDEVPGGSKAGEKKKKDRRRTTRARTIGGAVEDGLFNGGLTHASVVELMSSWSFDLIGFNEKCGGEPLYHVAMAHFISLDFEQQLGVNRDVFQTFAKQIESGYFATNAYHNATHAADVVHGTMFLLNAMEMSDGALSFEQLFSALVAATVHDFHHPGHTSAFIIKTQQPLAVRYSDDSPIERMHLAESFFIILQSEGCNVFESFDDVAYRDARALVIELVLATDLKQHFSFVGALKKMVASGSSAHTLFKADPTAVLKLALKAADIGHSAKSRTVHIEWTANIVEEVCVCVCVCVLCSLLLTTSCSLLPPTLSSSICLSLFLLSRLVL